MIREIPSIISASPSPLEQLEKARDADSVSRLFADIRQARAEREASRSKRISFRPNQIGDLESLQARLGETAAKAQVAAASVQGVANQHFGSDKITLSAQAQQSLDVPTNLVPPSSALSQLRTETAEVERENARKRTRKPNRQSEDEAEKGRNSSKSTLGEADSVEGKARQLIDGLRSDFESSISVTKRNNAKTFDLGLADATLGKPAASIRALRNGELGQSIGTNEQPVNSEPQKLAPLAGLKIEKSDSGQLSITKLPNRVTVGGHQFDLSNGPVTLNPDGSIETPPNAGGVNGLKADRPSTSGESDSGNGLLGLAVRGGPNVKLAPKNGKISATATSAGEIEAAGVRVTLAAGTSVLINSDSKGRIQIDESETRLSLGKHTFSLRGGQQITLGEDPAKSALVTEDAPQPNAAPPSLPAKAQGFTPLFQSLRA